MNTQGAAKPAESAGSADNTSTNVENIRKGRKVLKIPLLEGAGTGVQVKN
tara:strand:+ start:128 stop:277 length:150 start_codon:yes stop_codon:yes gene_type:complete